MVDGYHSSCICRIGLAVEYCRLVDITSHDGSPSLDASLFFDEPDSLIGEVVSRALTLPVESVAVAGAQVSLAFVPVRVREWGGLAAACTFVGREGLQRTRRVYGRLRREIIRFDDVAELRVVRDRVGLTLVSKYIFVDLKEADGFVIESREGPDSPRNAAHSGVFAEACERVYVEHVFRRHEAELHAHGSVRFSFNARDAVQLGPGFIEVHTSGRVVKLDASMVRRIALSRGVLEIWSGAADAETGASQGIYRIRLDEPRHYVHRFAVLLQQLVGINLS